MKVKTLRKTHIQARHVRGFDDFCSVSHRAIRLGACLTLMSLGTVTPSATADGEIDRYLTPMGTLEMANVPSIGPSEVTAPPVSYGRRASAQAVERAVARYAWQYDVHPALLLAVIKAESDFKPTVISRAGAVGLMQLLPETAVRHGVQNLYDTEDNIAGGVRHLRYLLDRFKGNLPLTLAAYNAGERRVDRYRSIPPYRETQAYVKKVLHYYRSFKIHYQKHPERAVSLAIKYVPSPSAVR